jgi:hypothetical protein
MWVAVAVCLLSGGCQSAATRSVERLIHAPVCPVCKATSISECHCFHVAENAGYCQTSWTSLEPAADTAWVPPGSGRPAGNLPAEELPVPQVAPAEPGGDAPTGDLPTPLSQGLAPELPATAASWTLPVPSSALSSPRGIAVHVADKEEPHSDQR